VKEYLFSYFQLSSQNSSLAIVCEAIGAISEEVTVFSACSPM